MLFYNKIGLFVLGLSNLLRKFAINMFLESKVISLVDRYALNVVPEYQKEVYCKVEIANFYALFRLEPRLEQLLSGF